MSKFAWVTLTTNDTYSLGALVLAHSLRRAGTVHQLAVLVTPGVSESMRAKLKDVYNVVQEVNVMDSQDSANLALLSRPELGVTFTKLHCWRLVQFEKCVFLDADTLILQNCDELFEREEFSAAPDVSWPDCFNSGVFVYKPSQATFDKIVEFAVKYGSFDGGDQGLLNQYFADWATSDIRKRLPFLYNVTAYASYCYLPAFKQFRDKIKILHFAGKMKPWLIHFNSQSRVASVPSDYSHANDLIQLWWNIFFDHVHGQLTTNMHALLQESKSMDHLCDHTNEQSNNEHSERYYCPTIMPWKSNYDYIRMQQQQELEQKHSEYHHNDNHNDNDNNNSNYNQHKEYVDEFYENQEITFHDPWEDYYRKLEEEAEMQRIKAEEEARRHFEWQQQQEQQQQHQQHHMGEYNQNYEETPREEQWQGHQQQQAEDYGNSESHYQQPEDQNIHTFTQEHEHISDHSHHWREDYHSEEVEHQHQSYDHHDPPEHYAHETYQESHIPSPTYNEDCKCSSNIEAEQLTHVLSNYDSSELNLRDQDIERATDISQEPAMTSRLTADQVTISDDEETEEGEEVGLAGALSQLRLGEQRTPEQEAYEHMMRRQCWESGQVDYMGRDSFENIWKRIQQTMDSKPQAPAAAAAEDEKKEMLTSADIEDGKVEVDPKTGVKTEYFKVEGGYSVKTTTPQPNGGWKSSTQTYYDPKPMSEEDMKKQMEAKKTIKTRMNKEIRIDERTTMLTREIEGGYEEVYTTINEDGSKSVKTKTFFDAVPEGTPFPDGAHPKPAGKQVATKKTTSTRKASIESTDSTDSRKMVQKFNKNTTVEESRSITQNFEITEEHNRTVRKNSLQTEQTIKSITNVTDGSSAPEKKKKVKKTKTQAPPPPADFVQNDTTSVSTKTVPGGIEYIYTTTLESGKTITTSKTVYEEEESELTEEEIKAYKKALKDAEKHKNITTTKKLKSESGTKKVVPSENPGDVTTVETIKIQGGTEYHYTTVTSEGIVKKAVKTVYDPVPCSNPDDTEEEEIIEEYEEEIIEPGEKNIRTIETIKTLPQTFEEEVTITHEKKEKKTKKTMTMVSQ